MPTYHYKYVYKYIKSTVIDEKPKYHDDDSSRRRKKRHSSSSARMEESGSRDNESLRPLWVTVNKIDNHFGSGSKRYRHRDDERDHDRHHSHGDRSCSSCYLRRSDSKPENPWTQQNDSGPPSPSPSRPRPTQSSPSTPSSPRPKPHSSVGLDMTSSVSSYVDAGTNARDYWYYPPQTVLCPTPVAPPHPYTSTESWYGQGSSMFNAPAYGFTYCSNQVVNLGRGQCACDTVPMVMCSTCYQSLSHQGYPCLARLHI